MIELLRHTIITPLSHGLPLWLSHVWIMIISLESVAQTMTLSKSNSWLCATAPLLLFTPQYPRCLGQTKSTHSKTPTQVHVLQYQYNWCCSQLWHFGPRVLSICYLRIHLRFMPKVPSLFYHWQPLIWLHTPLHSPFWYIIYQFMCLPCGLCCSVILCRPPSGQTLTDESWINTNRWKTDNLYRYW